MNPVLADPATEPGRQATQPDPAPAAPEPPAGVRSCSNCGAPMQAGQDWCLQCGARGPGGLRSGRPLWRSTGAALAAVALLALAAAGAGYAALTKGKPAPLVVRHFVAAAPATPPPAAPAPGLGTPTTIKPPPITKAPTPAKAIIPVVPKVATPPVTPATSTPVPAPSGNTPSSPSSPSGASGGEHEASGPEPILIDTNAASTYNPAGLAPSDFGDPSLTIDNEASTGWTALVEPATAPRMAAGVAIDLHAAKRVGALVLITSTPGITVQVLGAASGALPATIADAAWKKLSSAVTVKKRHTRIPLREGKHAFRFFLLWLSRAPASAVGTPQAPRRVSVNEIELLPAA